MDRVHADVHAAGLALQRVLKNAEAKVRTELGTIAPGPYANFLKDRADTLHRWQEELRTMGTSPVLGGACHLITFEEWSRK